jgi:signal transduction histidine kinase
MTQVFRNLVENAVQHSAPGDRVVVSADRVEAGRSLVEVRVADSGPGFSNEDLPHVFDPFFTRRRGGTGLGLAIVRRVVEDHGGQVAGRNLAPRGAEVVVRLPAP